MAKTEFPYLASPLAIGQVILKNRIVSSGHDTVMVSAGRTTEQLVAYHAARAQGGAGLIVVQVAGVHESARYTSHILMAADDSCIPGYEQLAQAVHPHGTRLIGQLFHPGKEVMESQDGSLPVALAPSSIPNERFRVMPRALAASEIWEIQAGYAAAACRLILAGLDGVEIVASHGYLPSQFLNPTSNQREDSYGGTPGNRLRFLVEVLEKIREKPGKGVVGLRISVGERDPNGLPEEIALEALAFLSERKLIDYASVTTGTSASLGGSDHIVPDMAWANGYAAPLARRVKELVDVPVMIAGRINQPQDAERIIASGDADACVMTRALICDPRMPELAFAGRSEEIRACVACNQACIGHFHAGYPISCIQHPETGRESRFGRRIAAPKPKRVLVVGGGPGGLKAAAVAAERGNQVTIAEAGSRLGGQVLLAEQLPGREEFGGVAQNLIREVVKSGAQVRTGTRADMHLIRSLSPDAVIVATGSTPYRPPITVMGSPIILDARQVIAEGVSIRGNAAVIDWRGDWVGIGVARILAARGNRVTLVTPGYAPGETLQQYVRDGLLSALHHQHVDIVTLARLYGVDDDTVYLQHVLTEQPMLLEDVGGTVLATGSQPSDQLLRELESSSIPTYGVGDCMAPRTVEEAVLDGLIAGSTV